MIPTYYDTPEKIEQLETVARRWLGTPYRENSAVVGSGVSCQFLAGSIFKETGFLPMGFQIPHGSARKLIRGPARALVDYVDANLSDKFAVVPDSEPKLPGDLMVLDHEGIFKHFTVIIKARHFVHVLRAVGVIASHLDDGTYANRVTEVRRPKP